MSTSISRASMMATLEDFRAFWVGTGDIDPATLFAPDVDYASSHRGQARGIEQLVQIMGTDFEGVQDLRLRLSNPVARAAGDTGLVAAYLLGEGRVEAGQAMFGGMLILELAPSGAALKIGSIRQQIGWIKGSGAAFRHWTRPSEQLWQPGDPAATIVSELDAPLHRLASSSLALSDEEAIAEAWYTYAWALDMADTSLYRNCFSDDASALLPPMGELQGRRMLTATLKAFRMPWPSIQHYGEPVDIVLDQSGEHASMVIGRLIPGATTSPEGKPLYGAHYRIELVRDHDSWKMKRMAYYPGWFTV